MTYIFKLAITFVLLLLFSISYAQQSSGLDFSLPDQEDWVHVTEKSEAGQYLNEWVPKGNDIETTRWLIAEQKLVLSKKSSSKKYIRYIFRLAKKACSNVLYNGPKKDKIDGITSYYGRIMCAKRIGQEYGTFTDIRVIVTGVDALIINSELRIPPSPVAGTLSFDDPTKIAPFMKSAMDSSKFISEGISLCHMDSNDCKER